MYLEMSIDRSIRTECIVAKRALIDQEEKNTGRKAEKEGRGRGKNICRLITLDEYIRFTTYSNKVFRFNSYLC